MSPSTGIADVRMLNKGQHGFLRNTLLLSAGECGRVVGGHRLAIKEGNTWGDGYGTFLWINSAVKAWRGCVYLQRGFGCCRSYVSISVSLGLRMSYVLSTLFGEFAHAASKFILHEVSRILFVLVVDLVVVCGPLVALEHCINNNARRGC